MEYEVGKRYLFTDTTELGDMFDFYNPDNSFVVVEVDSEGDAWTRDVEWGGVSPMTSRGWCVATRNWLNDGTVVLKEE